MGDQQNCHVEFFLNVFQEFEDLCLDGNIKGSCRLISYQQQWLAGKCHGNHNTLSLPSRQLMRETCQPLFWIGNAASLKEINCFGPGFMVCKLLVQH